MADVVCKCSHLPKDHYANIRECTRCDCGEFRMADTKVWAEIPLACEECGLYVVTDGEWYKCRDTSCNKYGALFLVKPKLVTNKQGGRQSYIPVRYDLILPDWLREIAEVLHDGANTHGEENWHKIPMNDHLNHAMAHIQQYREGDRSERHLINIACRIMFAYWSDKNNAATS